MYGLINKAVQSLVEKNHGPEYWIRIKEKAGFTDDAFASMKAYPDSLTYGLVGAASEVLNISAPDLLEKIGYHWMSFTALEGYGEMLNAGGQSLPEFLQNLNLMHFRLGTIMPDMVMPHFVCKDLDQRSAELHYTSHREGLAPLVIGIVKALGDRFKTPCQVELIQPRSTESKVDVFKISW